MEFGPREVDRLYLRIADLEYRMWVAYYLRRWRNLLVASVSLLRPQAMASAEVA